MVVDPNLLEVFEEGDGLRAANAVNSDR